jgi:hypothetical protein
VPGIVRAAAVSPLAPVSVGLEDGPPFSVNILELARLSQLAGGKRLCRAVFRGLVLQGRHHKSCGHFAIGVPFDVIRGGG